MHISRTLAINIITYLVILILPLGFLTYFFYTDLIQQFQSITYEKEKNAYEDIATDIDQQIFQIKGIASQLSTNQDVLAYNLANDIDSKRRMINMLKYSLSFSDNINDIILIDNEKNIYTPAGSYTLQTYSETYRLPMEKIYDYISDTSSLSLRYLYPVYFEDNADKNVTYLACNYPFSSPYPSGKLIFQLDSDKFVKLSDCPYSVYYSGLLVAENREGEVPLTLGDSETLTDMNSSHIIVKHNMVTMKVDIDTKAVFQNFYTLRNQFVFLEIMLTLVSLLLISFFCYNNYQPLRHLKDTINRLGNNISIPDSSHKIYSEINDSIKFLEIISLNNKQLDDNLVKEKYHSSELWLSRLLNHQYKSVDSILDSLKEHGILLECSHYAVCIFKCGSPLSGEPYPLNNSLQNGFVAYYYHYTDTKIAAIIGGSDMTKTQLAEMVRIMMREINRQEVPVEAYIGSLYPEADNIHLSFMEAISLIDYEPVRDGNLHLYSSRDVTSNPMRYPQIEINNLNKAIRQKDLGTFDTIMHALIGQITNPVCDYTFAKTIIYALVNSILGALSSDADDGAPEEIRINLAKLERSACKADLIMLMQSIHTEVGKQLNSLPAQGMQEKIDAAIAYINEHYDDVDFFLGDVAERFDISNNNLSQQFKRKFGISPSKYVACARVEKAKMLLLETSLPVNDISLRCGFSEPASFLRNFKSLTIVTPTQYRNANQAERKQA